MQLKLIIILIFSVFERLTLNKISAMIWRKWKGFNYHKVLGLVEIEGRKELLLWFKI